ncbi:MAG: hypothetical protein Q9182_006979 [Xanthomendoza sp. 2 TL-2023]
MERHWDDLQNEKHAPEWTLRAVEQPVRNHLAESARLSATGKYGLAGRLKNAYQMVIDRARNCCRGFTTLDEIWPDRGSSGGTSGKGSSPFCQRRVGAGINTRPIPIEYLPLESAISIGMAYQFSLERQISAMFMKTTIVHHCFDRHGGGYGQLFTTSIQHPLQEGPTQNTLSDEESEVFERQLDTDASFHEEASRLETEPWSKRFTHIASARTSPTIHKLAITTSLLPTLSNFLQTLRARANHRLRLSNELSDSDILAGLDVDGPADAARGPMNTRRRRLGGDVCAIFVHAGAGYHSVQNERIHLHACEQKTRVFPADEIIPYPSAAKAAMNVLSEGGGAVDAVEVAIRVLEDKEITNAGYGSNLSLEGTVECDATIVDHYGRSGAVGAVGQIQHPIHLARLVLDYSTKPLSLRRVPPNLLAGPGATDFAESLHMPVLPPDSLVSHSARDRWLNWARDLKAAESKASQSNEGSETGDSPTNYPQHLDEFEFAQPLAPSEPERQLYTMRQDPPGSDHSATSPAKRMNMDATISPTPPHVTWAGQPPGNDGEPEKAFGDLGDGDADAFVDENPPMTRPVPPRRSTAQSEMGSNKAFTLAAIPSPVLEKKVILRDGPPPAPQPPIHYEQDAVPFGSVSLDDDITDTVGAIAIDCLGNIAAGSSSGGIGMKHKGRIGPAALVGVGTAVVPAEPDDPEKTSVATVTSGTGEHMATTMAASTCANRLYTSTRKSKRGGSESTDDDSAIKGFIEKDFMGHPSVRTSYSTGGIGVLGVKKTNDGIWLYFAHNTDSFAMASMSSEESKPRSVMSRSKENNRVVSGGRSIKYHRGHTWPVGHHSTWPGHVDPSPSPEQPAKRQKRHRVPPTGVPPSESDSEEQDSNHCYKVVYKQRMREVYGPKTGIAEHIARIKLRSQSSGTSDRGLGP